MKTQPQTFSERLSLLFTRADTPRPSIEKQIGVSPATVTKWLNNDGISDDNLFLLADALGVNWVELKYGEGEYRKVCESYIDEKYGDEVKGLKLNSEILKSVLDLTCNEIFVIDDEDQFIYVSDCASKNLGYSNSELSSMTPYDIKPTLNKSDFSDMKKAVENKGDIISFTVPHQRRDGSEYSLKINFRKTGGANPAYVALGRGED